MLGISVHTVRSWRTRGVGPAYRRLGRTIRYNRAEVQRWHDETLVPARPFRRRSSLQGGQ
jgi:predicted DNA-binding transcriptional regulator AlpA